MAHLVKVRNSSIVLSVHGSSTRASETKGTIWLPGSRSTWSALLCAVLEVYQGSCCSSGLEVAHARGLNSPELHQVHMTESLCTAGWFVERLAGMTGSFWHSPEQFLDITQVTPGRSCAAAE